MIETFLSFPGPIERYGLAEDAAGELREGADDVGIVRDKPRGLDKDTQHFAKFRYIGGGNHAADGVEVFVGKTGACFVHLEAKESADRETDHCLRRVQSPIFFFAQGEEIGVTL